MKLLYKDKSNGHWYVNIHYNVIIVGLITMIIVILCAEPLRPIF